KTTGKSNRGRSVLKQAQLGTQRANAVPEHATAAAEMASRLGVECLRRARLREGLEEGRDLARRVEDGRERDVGTVGGRNRRAVRRERRDGGARRGMTLERFCGRIERG